MEQKKRTEGSEREDERSTTRQASKTSRLGIVVKRKCLKRGSEAGSRLQSKAGFEAGPGGLGYRN